MTLSSNTTRVSTIHIVLILLIGIGGISFILIDNPISFFSTSASPPPSFSISNSSSVPSTLLPTEHTTELSREGDQLHDNAHINKTVITGTSSASSSSEKSKLLQCPPVSKIVGCTTSIITQNQSQGEGLQQDGVFLLPCHQCIDKSLWKEDVFYANNTNTDHGKTRIIYMPLIVPPFFGSSMLSNIMSSSPTVYNMCSLGYWQCESTAFLMQNKLVRWKERWNPISSQMWSKIYDTFHKKNVWNIQGNSTQPLYILTDKTPPNIAKVPSLVEYFEELLVRKNSSSKSNNDLFDIDYRFVVMWRHPCRTSWNEFNERRGTKLYEEYLKDILLQIPKSKRFFINYDDLLLRPSLVITKLLSWLPELQYLSTNTNEIRNEDANNEKRGGFKGNSLKDYVFVPSNNCTVSNYNTARFYKRLQKQRKKGKKKNKLSHTKLPPKSTISNEQLYIWEQFISEVNSLTTTGSNGS